MSYLDSVYDLLSMNTEIDSC